MRNVKYGMFNSDVYINDLRGYKRGVVHLKDMKLQELACLNPTYSMLHNNTNLCEGPVILQNKLVPPKTSICESLGKMSEKNDLTKKRYKEVHFKIILCVPSNKHLKFSYRFTDFKQEKMAARKR